MIDDRNIKEIHYLNCFVIYARIGVFCSISKISLVIMSRSITQRDTEHFKQQKNHLITRPPLSDHKRGSWRVHEL